MYVALIEGCSISGCISLVFCIADGEVVCAREIFLGTHIYIFMVGMVEHSVYDCYAWHTYWSGREAFVLLCVIGRIHFEVLVQDAP